MLCVCGTASSVAQLFGGEGAVKALCADVETKASEQGFGDAEDP
jgi:hypothetical protein